MLNAYSYPLLSIFWSLLEFAAFIILIWLLVIVFIDIFRSHDLAGWAKALWVIFVIILPLLGILVYLIARGSKMHERAVAQARQEQQTFDSAVRQAASSSNADELAKLSKLKDQGALTAAEFEAQKQKLLAG
jgi:ABC-type multidrug transport system fused ATPase/permease subunit